MPSIYNSPPIDASCGLCRCGPGRCPATAAHPSTSGCLVAAQQQPPRSVRPTSPIQRLHRRASMHPLSPLGVKSLGITPARSHARAHALHVLPVADTKARINSPLCCATSPLILGDRVPRLLQLRPTADARTRILTLTRQCARACPQDGRAHKSAAK